MTDIVRPTALAPRPLLPTRAARILAEHGCLTPDDVAKLSRSQLSRVAGCGPATIAAVERWLRATGREFRSQPIDERLAELRYREATLRRELEHLLTERRRLEQGE